MNEHLIRSHVQHVVAGTLTLLDCFGEPNVRSATWRTWNQIGQIPLYLAEALFVSRQSEVVACLRNLQRVARETREALEAVAGRGAG